MIKYVSHRELTKDGVRELRSLNPDRINIYNHSSSDALENRLEVMGLKAAGTVSADKQQTQQKRVLLTEGCTLDQQECLPSGLGREDTLDGERQ